MKRLIFGLFVTAIAVTAAAFTTPAGSPGSLADYYFAFDYGNHTPTVDNVEDPSKWIKVTDMSGCSSGSARACKLRVSDTYVDELTETLDPSFIIQADDAGTPDVARVTSSQASQIFNRANP